MCACVACRSDGSGYLDKGEFQELLGKHGLNLKLPLDEVEMVIDEIADTNGAIEAKDFTRFLAVRRHSLSGAVLATV